MTAAALKRGLGKGLEALLSDNQVDGGGVDSIDLSLIDSNPYQPRVDFNEEGMADLASSIREHGVIQPIIIRRNGARYHIIAGERRVRASRMAGLAEIPAIVKEADDSQMMQLAVIENVQRQDLNPVEEASAYRRLIDEFDLTQEDVSVLVGKSRSAVANILRLNKLPADVLALVSRETISEGHARALLGLKSPEAQSKLAKEAVRRKLSVRQLEEAISRLSQVRRKTRKGSHRDPDIVAAEDMLRRGLGTKVRISGSASSGKIEVFYYSQDDLDRIIEKAAGSEQ